MLTKAQILARLYNASQPQGLGFLHFNAEPMTEQQAQDLLVRCNGNNYFDYLQGRVMKVDIDEAANRVDGWARLYDRDNGPGAGERALQEG